MRNTKVSIVAAGLLAVALAASPAMADLMVTYDMSAAKLDYTGPAANALTVTDTLGSQLQVRLEDTTALTIIDTAKIDSGAAFDLTVDLVLTDLAGVDNWSAAGTLKFTDTVTATNAVEATFVSDSITIWGGANILLITGYLVPIGPPATTSILVNRGDPWKYVGSAGILGEPDGDGVDGQITVNKPEFFDHGDLWVLKFGVGTPSLDTLFGASFTVLGGEVKGTIVPVPAAVLLGLIGLGLVGWKMRKYA